MLCTELKSIFHWFSQLFIDNWMVANKVHDTLNLYWSFNKSYEFLIVFNQTVLLILLFCMIDFRRGYIFLNLSIPIETYCLYECRPLSSVTKSKLLVVAIWPNWNVNQTKLVVGPGAGQLATWPGPFQSRSICVTPGEGANLFGPKQSNGRLSGSPRDVWQMKLHTST